MKTSLRSILLTTWGIGWAIVDLRTVALPSESHIPGGSRVTAVRIPSYP
ncbi:hypothetical protein J7K07_06390 [Candidatus Bathyarchaeota archaeon]|nr:hypothetical protein [Candidatus Bathyarchaeota archaeon]